MSRTMKSTLFVLPLLSASFMISACGSENKSSRVDASLTPLFGNYIYNLAECEDPDSVIKASPDDATLLEFTETEFNISLEISDDCIYMEKRKVKSITASKLDLEFVSASASTSCPADIRENISSYRGPDWSFTHKFSNGILRLSEKRFCDAWIKR